MCALKPHLSSGLHAWMKASRRDCLLFLCSHHAPRNLSDLTGNTNKVIWSLHESFYLHRVQSSAFSYSTHTYAAEECCMWAHDWGPGKHLKVSRKVFWKAHIQWRTCEMSCGDEAFCEIKMSFIMWEFLSATRNRTAFFKWNPPALPPPFTGQNLPVTPPFSYSHPSITPSCLSPESEVIRRQREKERDRADLLKKQLSSNYHLRKKQTVHQSHPPQT